VATREVAVKNEGRKNHYKKVPCIDPISVKRWDTFYKYNSLENGKPERKIQI